jgi:hypothetical protein
MSRLRRFCEALGWRPVLAGIACDVAGYLVRSERASNWLFVSALCWMGVALFAAAVEMRRPDR